MGWHPLNLGLRFLLELTAIWAMGYWGWTQHSGFSRWVLVIGVPLVAMSVWGTFRVPDDPREPPIAVRGYVRLILEAVILSSSVLLLYMSDQRGLAIGFALVLLLHYLLSYDRVIWLLTER